MVLCSNPLQDGLNCGHVAEIEISSYISHMPITGEVGYSKWWPSCVDCFAEMLHEGPQQDGGDNQDGWVVRWILN